MTRGDNLDLFPDELPHEAREIDYSPASIAQRERLLAALRLGPVSTLDAREQLGILMPAARIFELRELGFDIHADYLATTDAHGVARDRIAHYSLISSPAPETPPHPVAAPSGPGKEVRTMANNRSQTKPALVTRAARGYSPTVAANSANQIGVWEPQGGHRLRAVFLCPQKHGMPVMGGPCGVPSGTPVSCGRYANLHGSAHPDWRRGVGEKLRTQEAIAMTPRHPLTLATPSRRARANRHRRLALSALKLDSSLSVRLSRYWHHIAAARQLEAVEVRHA